MKRQRVDSQVERQLLTAMIVSDRFLASAAEVVDISLLDSSHFQQVAQWCIDYHRQYQEAPKQHIEAVYHSWAEHNDGPDAEAIHAFLNELSEDYEHSDQLNVPYLLDQLGEHLTLRKAARLQDNLEFGLLKGDSASVLESVRGFEEVNLGRGVGVDPLNDETAWERAFAEPLEPLVVFPGDGGRFLNPALTRDALIAIQGAEKRGKTWWCLEFAFRALRERRRVALFEAGDLSETQLMMRLGIRLTGRPLWDSQLGRVPVPIKLRRERNKEGDWKTVVETKTEVRRRVVSQGAAARACRRYIRGMGMATGKPYLMTSVHSMGTLTVHTVRSILKSWEMTRGFIPDVIIIDYADILAPEDSRKETRHQINDTWKALRRLSQDYHALVIVPTQADAQSYTTKTQSMRNFSEDKRKLSHVTGMLGLNQTPEEKKHGVMRLNWIVLRESPFHPYHCLYVGQCLTLGRSFCCAAL